VTLKVVDISGRVVRTVASGSMPAGPHSAEWDGTDENGNAVPAGIYLYRLEAPGQRADRKITVLH
jgi:flagellar hook assembly protein FlgD